MAKLLAAGVFGPTEKEIDLSRLPDAIRAVERACREAAECGVSDFEYLGAASDAANTAMDSLGGYPPRGSSWPDVLAGLRRWAALSE